MDTENASSESSTESKLREMADEGKIFFCYMVVNEGKNQKSKTILKVTNNILRSLKRINKQEEKKKDPSIWKLEIVVAGFSTINEAHCFREIWKTNSRGIEARKKKAQHLSIIHNLLYIDATIERFYVKNVVESTKTKKNKRT